MQILTLPGSISLCFPGLLGAALGRRQERAMLQPCDQGSCRVVGNLLLLEAHRDGKYCILTCCDLNIFLCLYFQNGN